MAKLVTELMNKDPDLKQQMGGRSFDVVSAKGYWDWKETNWHQDIQSAVTHHLAWRFPLRVQYCACNNRMALLLVSSMALLVSSMAATKNYNRMARQTTIRWHDRNTQIGQKVPKAEWCHVLHPVSPMGPDRQARFDEAAAIMKTEEYAGCLTRKDCKHDYRLWWQIKTVVIVNLNA